MNPLRLKAALAASLLGVSALALAQVDWTHGEVRKIDQENQKITLKHGQIKNLDMPGMTMVFAVPDPKLLEKLHVGDKVRFVAANEGGKLTVTQIEADK